MAELHIPRTLPEGASVIPLVRNAIAVASSKGGVGKSTVCINTALSMARMGASVGLLDADIYGPSVQLMTGIQQQPEITSDNRLLPVEAHGMSMMSMGFLADENTPVVWRGPLLAQRGKQDRRPCRAPGGEGLRRLRGRSKPRSGAHGARINASVNP